MSGVRVDGAGSGDRKSDVLISVLRLDARCIPPHMAAVWSLCPRVSSPLPPLSLLLPLLCFCVRACGSTDPR
ncbi:hypothetical protein JOB18_018283 [Solea senegalensis]|uniref:Uncharacterized protein n=1 Tax=Solea senegalensis TaxID=28829 RepID=A0AAV6PPM7_SOLSE|nr:hypothetical protein JOB18_018283 [Solea senegalensis]